MVWAMSFKVVGRGGRRARQGGSDGTDEDSLN